MRRQARITVALWYYRQHWPDQRLSAFGERQRVLPGWQSKTSHPYLRTGRKPAKGYAGFNGRRNRDGQHHHEVSPFVPEQAAKNQSIHVGRDFNE